MSLKTEFPANVKEELSEKPTKLALLNLFKAFVQAYCSEAMEQIAEDTIRNRVTSYLDSREKKDILISSMFCKIIAESKGDKILNLFNSYLQREQLTVKNSRPLDSIRKFVESFDIILNEDGQTTKIISLERPDEEDFIVQIENALAEDNDDSQEENEVQ